MATDPHDELWAAVFDTLYDSGYEELVAEKLVRLWQKVDETTKVIVALFTTGSAVSGWSLWTDAHFKPVWAAMAGLAAVLAIVHAALGVPERLRDHGESKRRFTSLRIDLETLRYRMRVDPNFPVNEFEREFLECRKRFSDGVQAARNDIFRTDRLERKAQSELNVMLREEIGP